MENILFEAKKFVTPPAPYNRSGVNPALLTLPEYTKLVNSSEKSHPSDAYDMSVSELNGHAGAKASEYPILLRRLKLNGMGFEFRMKGEPKTYAARDSQGEIARDALGNVLIMSPEEIVQSGRQSHEFSISVFNEDGERVAASQDEWGCMLIMVAREYRGFGIGPILGKMARHFEPTKPSGGFTYNGYKNFVKVYREMVRDALQSGLYRKLVNDGQMTIERARDIIKSAQLGNRVAAADKINLSTKDPSDWLVLGEYGGFTIYDKKLKEIYIDHLYEWGDRFIKGHVLVRVIKTAQGNDVGLLVNFGGDSTEIKRFLVACAASYCSTENVLLALDPEDIKYVSENLYEMGTEDMTTGYKRTLVRIRKPINLIGLVKADRVFRAQFDQYGEFKQIVLELGDSKYRQS